jgi:hypothetical protein
LGGRGLLLPGGWCAPITLHSVPIYTITDYHLRKPKVAQGMAFDNCLWYAFFFAHPAHGGSPCQLDVSRGRATLEWQLRSRAHRYHHHHHHHRHDDHNQVTGIQLTYISCLNNNSEELQFAIIRVVLITSSTLATDALAEPLLFLSLSRHADLIDAEDSFRISNSAHF